MSHGPEVIPEQMTALFAEAERQLNICNACRYCEGYCAVFPALERRTILTSGDIVHLANVCHDCRACLYACMYAPPHEFGVDVPHILSEVRRQSYDQTVTTGPVASATAPRNVRAAAVSSLVVTVAIVVALAVISEGASALWQARRGATSPYAVVSYPVILVALGLPFLWSIGALARAGARYWGQTRGPLADLWNLTAWRRALSDAGQLRYLKGGGANCPYPADRPSPLRRRLHAAVAYGFTSCLLATISAGVEQDLLGVAPPYPWLSVPVVAGTLGGVGMVVGCVGLIALKTRTDSVDVDVPMRSRDYNLLWGLLILAVTGLAVLTTRTRAVYGPFLVVHLAAVAVAFAIAPFTKFSHVLYRLLALVQDNLERQPNG